MGVREFRDKFVALREPVRVVHSKSPIEVLGVWTPVKREEEHKL